MMKLSFPEMDKTDLCEEEELEVLGMFEMLSSDLGGQTSVDLEVWLWLRIWVDAIT